MADDAAAAAAATPTSTLICREDGSDLFADDDGCGGADVLVTGDDHLLILDRDEEYVALMLSKEHAAASTGGGDGARGEEVGWMKSARAGCVRWILKKNARFGFSGKTAYVAVAYFDRFMSHRRVDSDNEWALHLLSVACLSLAAKVEERRAPRLPEFFHLHGQDPYEFDSASILRMELLVLGTLQWRMITVTPFSYLSCLAAGLRDDERKAIILGAVRCIYASIKVVNLAEYQPSTIALASILVARSKEASSPIPNLDELKAILGSSWQQLDTGHVSSCYSAMVQEDDGSMRSTEVASSGMSVGHIASSGSSTAANNAIAATSAAASTPDNKKKRLHSPQRQ